jgi:hypothetical protein
MPHVSSSDYADSFDILNNHGFPPFFKLKEVARCCRKKVLPCCRAEVLPWRGAAALPS